MDYEVTITFVADHTILRLLAVSFYSLLAVLSGRATLMPVTAIVIFNSVFCLHPTFDQRRQNLSILPSCDYPLLWLLIISSFIVVGCLICFSEIRSIWTLISVWQRLVLTSLILSHRMFSLQPGEVSTQLATPRC